MSKMVLMKPDGTYEEFDVSTKKIIDFQSRGYKVYTWKEMFENTLASTTEKIMHLEGQILGMDHAHGSMVDIRDKMVKNLDDAEAIINHYADHRNWTLFSDSEWVGDGGRLARAYKLAKEKYAR